MKKILCLVLVALLLAGCSAPATATVEPSAPEVTEEPATETENEAFEITYQSARAYTNSIGTTWAQSIVEITNTGSVPLFLSSGAFDLEDADGKLVATSTMVSAYPSVIDVGEKGYMYEEAPLDEEPASALTVLPRPDVEKAKVDLVRFSVTDEELKDGDYGVGLKLLGRVENTSAEAQSSVYVACVLYDAAGAPIGIMFTILMEELAPGAKIGFECNGLSLPEDVTLDAVASHVTYAYPMQMQF
ncbi:MAG: FxLYD domain-containing protein [Clostridia bacterium]